MQDQKGFTIIELIVVIAIIAVLAAIVLVNVTSYINKSKDIAALGNLNAMITNSAIFFDKNNGNYYQGWSDNHGDCVGGDPGFKNPCMALINMKYNQGTMFSSCNTTSNCQNGAQTPGGPDSKWCMVIQSKADSSKYYCVDTTGAKYFSSTTRCLAYNDISGNGGTCTP